MGGGIALGESGKPRSVPLPRDLLHARMLSPDRRRIPPQTSAVREEAARSCIMRLFVFAFSFLLALLFVSDPAAARSRSDHRRPHARDHHAARLPVTHHKRHARARHHHYAVRSASRRAMGVAWGDAVRWRNDVVPLRRGSWTGWRRDDFASGADRYGRDDREWLPFARLHAAAIGRSNRFTGDLSSMIARHAQMNGVPEGLVRRVVLRESGGNPRAVGRGGAMGLMQIKTSTARAMGYAGPPSGLLDPETNLTYAVRYLAGAYRVAGGNANRAVSNYASGYHGVARARGFSPYVRTDWARSADATY